MVERRNEMQIADGIFSVGVNDHQLDLFEAQFGVPDGMAYNSYVILDNKIAVMDSVEAHFGQEWLANVEAVLDGREPDYLVVQHMEPDHSANIELLVDKYPQLTVIGTVGAFNMMQGYFGRAFEDRRLVVKDGDTLDLGTKQFEFITAPLVHWPEVMFTYDATDKLLFSADAFGTFGATDNEATDFGLKNWDDEARRYYFGIVGKFGANVQKALNKALAHDIQIICSLHGPVLSKNLEHYVSLYKTWSSYEPEDKGVTIAYSSVYDHTRQVVNQLHDALVQRGVSQVHIHDLAREDQSHALEDAFRYSHLVLATTTYNGGVFPAMHDFISHLVDHNYQNRMLALIENGSWMPSAAKGMRSLLEPCSNLEYAHTVVTVKGSLNTDSRAQLETLADELSNELVGEHTGKVTGTSPDGPSN